MCVSAVVSVCVCVMVCASVRCFIPCGHSSNLVCVIVPQLISDHPPSLPPLTIHTDHPHSTLPSHSDNPSLVCVPQATMHVFESNRVLLECPGGDALFLQVLFLLKGTSRQASALCPGGRPTLLLSLPPTPHPSVCTAVLH